MQAYVGKLERKVTAGNVKKGSFAVLSATPIKRVEKESLLDALAELQDENTRLHGALRVSKLEIRACEAAWITFSTTLSPWSRDDNNQQEVEEAVDVEAKSLGLADGGALLESLRTRRLLESAELALKVSTFQRTERALKHISANG